MRQKRVQIDQLKRGPVRHPELSPLLLARIRSLRSKLAEVHPLSMEEWLDGFQRDAHPENEVAWWERVARCYAEYSGQKELNLQQRQAAFKLIFGLAIGSTEENLEADLDQLPASALDEIASIMRGSKRN
jgi:hypothetical protein